MANKRGRHRRGGRVTPKGTRPRQHKGGGEHLGSHEEPELLTEVRRRLREEHPFPLLAEASSLYAAFDPRDRNPFDREPPAGPTREELISSFLEVDCGETSALLHIFAELADDELVEARIRRQLGQRCHPLPSWLTNLHDTRPYRAAEMAHVLRDGDNVLLGVRLAGGYELTVVVYIDHNLGGVVKDAFVVPQPIADLIAFMREKSGDDPDMSWNDISPADARARITEAVAMGAMTFPPYTTDTWPACRPLVEWVARLLPEGGRSYERPEWEQDDLEELAERFLGSPFGTAFRDDPDQLDLLDSLLWLGSAFGPGDPLHWSPVAVEILLLDLVPRKIVAPAHHLAQAPDLVRALIRFAHHDKGIRPSLTRETLDAVDRHEREYQRIIRSPRPQGPMALLAALGAIDPDGPWADPETERSYPEIMRELLERDVGGPEQLDNLSLDPLPAEEFDWTVVPDDVRGRVAEVLELCDRCCEELLDEEFRTACRRVLARVVRGDASVFRRAGRAETAAAAICWSVGKANDLFSYTGRGMAVKDLLGHFGITQGGVSQRAQTLLRAGGFAGNDYGTVVLGSPELLVSARRKRIAESRDRYAALSDA